MSAIAGTSTSNGIDAIGKSAGAFGDLSTTEFVQIMVQELTNQDPFNPNDSQALLEQLSSLRQIESDMALQENMQALVQQNALSSATGFLGQVVSGMSETGVQATGRVSTLAIENGAAVLKLADGTRMPATHVTGVQNMTSLGEETTQYLLANMLAMDSSQLMGQNVLGKNEANETVSGIVTGITLDGADAKLELDNGKRLYASQVEAFLEID